MLSGADSNSLGEWADRLVDKLQSMPEFRDVSNEMQLRAAVTKLTIDRVAAAPASIEGTFRGNAQAFKESLATQPWLILAALAAVYIILGVLYESFVHPLTIFSTLPSAGVGAIFALWAVGQDFSMMALMLGFGTGSELRQPLGVAVFGGLLISQLLTLYTTPVIYLALDQVVNGRRKESNSLAPKPAHVNAAMG